MSVLVDTSVWIRFFAGRAPHADGLDVLLLREEVVGHPFVHGELLIGDNGGRAGMLRDYARILRAPVVPHDEVVAFVRQRALGGRGLAWIDAHLLASALVGGVSLWSADTALAAAAHDLGIAHA